MYAYLGEKTPWLIVHQILPFVPLAGLPPGRRSARRASRTAAIAVPVGVATVLATLSLSFWNPLLSPFNPRAESVVFTQTAPS